MIIEESESCKLNYQKAIDILTSQGKFYINLGLERVKEALDLLGNPQNNLQFIHVAGTNGKGSVCAMLSAILNERGKRKKERDETILFPVHCSPFTSVGLFTSPHVFEYTERIKINDVEIDKEIFAEKLNKIVDLADKNDIHLTEFEILAVLAFDYFAENKVDIVVLETGLGGRFDATNIIEKNLCSIITHIDLDHTERLGDTIEKIAFEKAGIIKGNCPLVISKNNLGFETIQMVTAEKNSEIFTANENRNFSIENSTLKGSYQQENLKLVLTAIEVLNKNGFNITQDAIEQGLKEVIHPCRFEYLQGHNIIIDGAHNPNGTKALRESLDFCYPGQNLKFIFGCLNNKQYKKMMENLFRENDEIYFYHFDNPNACTYEELSAVCGFNSRQFNDFKKDDSTLTVVCGSFYMIKELLINMGIK